jgi:hypothetical protein
MIKLTVVSLNYKYQDKKQKKLQKEIEHDNRIVSAVYSCIAALTDNNPIPSAAQVIAESTDAINKVLAKHIENSKNTEDEELELSDDDLERNDEIDNAVFDCVRILAEDDDIEWNMQIIAETTDAIKSVLADHDIKVRHPHIATHEDGSQTIEEYEEEL